MILSRLGDGAGAGLQFASIFVCAACLFGSLAVSVADEFDGSSYARNISLDANVDIFWTIDTEAEAIRLAVHAKSASGWVGVGMSEMGGMEGADILYYESSTGNITDAHTIVAGTPVIDECTQDWTLLSANVGDGSLMFEATRALDTGDVQDRVFVDDSQDGVLPTRLMSAWGDTDFVSYHGSSFAKGEVVMFGAAEDAELPLEDIKESGDYAYFDVTTKNFAIPEQRTWYEDTCMPASEMPSVEEYHVIAFEGLPEDDTAEYVHHFVLTGWYGPSDCGLACSEWMEENFPDDGSDGVSSGSTGTASSPSSYSVLAAQLLELNTTLPSFCEDYNYADIFEWTPGGSNVELPTDVGFLTGNSSTGFHSMSLQTHYNNPNGDVGMRDSSGVRVYYTEDLRPSDMGVIKLGDPRVTLDGTYLPDGKYGLSFNCPSSCTEENFEVEEVTKFYHFLHMHENGRTMRTRQYRTDSSGNEVLLHTAEIEYYSFLQAGGFSYTVNDSVTIRRGDRFETDCYYDTSYSSVGSSNVTFGFGSEQEMCIDYIYYYPDQKMPDSGACGLAYCGGGILAESELPSDSDFNRTFGMVDSCTDGEVGGTPGPARSEVDSTPAPLPTTQVGDDASSSPRATSPGLGLVGVSMTVALVSWASRG